MGDDGDSEQGVHKELIELMSQAEPEPEPEPEPETGASTTVVTAWRVGDAVQCRYGGGEAKYPGKISSVNADDTYDIAYDDGDSEQGVHKELIELMGTKHETAAIVSNGLDQSSFSKSTQGQGDVAGALRVQGNMYAALEEDTSTSSSSASESPSASESDGN